MRPHTRKKHPLIPGRNALHTRKKRVPYPEETRSIPGSGLPTKTHVRLMEDSYKTQTPDSDSDSMQQGGLPKEGQPKEASKEAPVSEVPSTACKKPPPDVPRAPLLRRAWRLRLIDSGLASRATVP